ncbi:ABC transporter ATP-binding protein [Maledivibacter halophilus]|uniref:Peptide/nickel transport system ATP-binding protein n=1 Tax=Maledivibacter halophilus TaxID=36842 RepID=A0A1T5M0P9_9FIRM|nr:ABC transporter ATP-binding protein [Maledivibacter halophilus]SKC81459.1 peptide/nickel transport system ATP-binding protein [Maledivibacter halophilus]
MIRLENITKIFKKRSFSGENTLAVDNVSLTIDKGKILGLVGESGCGKSTLGRIILRLTPVDKGKIYFYNRDITNYTFKEMQAIRREMQIIFQHPDTSLNPRKKIKHSLIEPFKIHRLSSKNEDNIMSRIMKYLDLVGLNEEILDRYPNQISGGQIQRVVLARVLVLEPKFLILDEATSMLDVSVQAQIIELLRKIKKEFDITYLFISHDIDLVKAFCDDIAVMKDGKIVELGSSERIYNSPVHEYTRKLVKTFREF